VVHDRAGVQDIDQAPGMELRAAVPGRAGGFRRLSAID
jgi:hypothetical protein